MQVAALAMLAALLPAASAVEISGNAGGTGEREAKAKFEILLAAGLYMHWPASGPATSQNSRSDIQLGVVGHQEYGNSLDALAASKTIAGRRVIVHRFESAADVKPCQILFISSSVARDERKALIERFQNSPVLLAGESAGFCREGGGLNLLTEGGQVKFALNPAALAQQKLSVDPRFSRLASSLTESPRDSTKPGAAKEIKRNNEPQPARAEIEGVPPHRQPPVDVHRSNGPAPHRNRLPPSLDVHPHPAGKRP